VFHSLEALIGDEQDVRLFWITDDEELHLTGDLIVDATEAIIDDHDQSHDSARWYRFDWNEVQRYRDGLTLDAMGGSAVFRAAAKILPRQSSERNDQFWLKATRETHTATAAAFGILAVPDQDNPAHRLNCGRAWQRMHLWATTRGLAMQPLNQLPERAAREQVLKLEPKFGPALRRLIGGQLWQALMVFRTGYPIDQALPSPRRAAESVIT
jgi:hypothetical protein